MSLWREMTKDERLVVVREGLALGMSFSQIAEPHGRTRNAVIGFAHRNGLTSKHVREPETYLPKAARERPARVTERRSPPPKPVEPARELRPSAAPAAAAMAIPVRPAVMTAPLSRRVPLLLRSSLECPWIDDQRGTDGLATVCGHETEPGSHWCGFNRLKARKAA